MNRLLQKAQQEFEVDTEGLPSNTIDLEVDSVGATWRASSKNPDMADPGQGKYNSRTSTWHTVSTS